MKVSVITPAYNQANFIEETIVSILEQDYPDIEYIVFDDGSTDITFELLQRYQGRLRYIRHDNIGESKTVNNGYYLCHGEIVGVVNSDDPLYSKDAISKIVSSFQEHPNALAVYPDWVSIDEYGQVIRQFSQPLFDISRLLLGSNSTLGPGMFIKRTALEKIGYRNEILKYTGDMDISFRLALCGELVHISEFLATHRVHLNAASTTSQGEVMANEVFNLGKSSIDSPFFPVALYDKRNEILANFCTIAFSFCGNNWLLKCNYLYRAFKFCPVFFFRWLILRIALMVLGTCKQVIRSVFFHEQG